MMGIGNRLGFVSLCDIIYTIIIQMRIYDELLFGDNIDPIAIESKD